MVRGARNPLPFCKLTVSLGPSRRFGILKDSATIEEARVWLEKRLNGF